MGSSQSQSHLQKGKFAGFSERLEERRRTRDERNVPQSWIARKLAVGIVLALWGYTYYVYCIRYCLAMINGEGEWGSKAMGIAFFAVFNLLWLMFGWTYIKVILTPPGFAKDHVSPSPPPQNTATGGPRQSWESGESGIGGPPYNASSNQSHGQASSTVAPNSDNLSSRHSPDDTTKAMQGEMRQLPPMSSTEMDLKPHHALPSAKGREIATEPTRPPPAATRPFNDPKLLPVHPRPNTAERLRQVKAREHGVPSSYFARHPPIAPVLLPEYRYCRRDGHIKPFRAHHCRQCATCVLGYDHHCPWIGHCVGHHNRKFFLIFIFWSTIFTAWTFATLVGPIAKQGGASIDAQHIVIMAISAIFTLFTVTLFVHQVYLVSINATTVEYLHMQGMHERESESLRRVYSCWDIRARRRTRREWDQEWGRIEMEGNLWWLDGVKANLEAVMGKYSLGRWILPIGKAPGDGLIYPTNGRFDKDGRWRRRTEWPPELR